MFQIFLFIIGLVAGGIASIAGFGIGSFLTPLLALKTGIGIAVAAVSISHFCGTALRFFLLRKYISRSILFSFGLMSAAGGLVGAFLHNWFQNLVLTIIFGCLLVLAGILGLTGLSEKIQLKGPLVWLLGGLSGLFGGLVGNQGGIRSAALLGFNMDKNQFVATATGIALMVDVARLPVYLAVQWGDLISIWQFILIMAGAVLVGTLCGRKALEKITGPIFKKIVSFIILAIGILVLVLR